jgi:hypothetical protein
MDWPLIVGNDLAAYTWPTKILRPGKNQPWLYLQVKSGWEMQAWAASPLIIERVNQYFGFQAIQRLKFVPGKLTTFSRS